MKLSERWLREWVDPPIDTAALVSQLTDAGFEVEGVEPAAARLEGLRVAEITACEPHPEAGHLSVCRVSLGPGAEPATVVCGAPNVRVGLLSAYAPPGARIGGERSVERVRIRGVDSEGMLCSAAELGLGEDAAGILELGPDAPPGESLDAHLALDDRVLDIAVNPNRGDCMGVAGIARELGVLNRTRPRGPAIDPVPAVIDDELPVVLESPGDCPRYAGRIIRDIDPRASTPAWLSERLRRAGLRAIHPVVDVTNYVMLELGQPMHAFDFERLSGRIRVRRAAVGERLALLDERSLALRPETLVIADERQAVALAGVMGGLESAVGDDTRHVFLESAFFEPRRLSTEARRYGLQTDSSQRFERGVDPSGQRRAIERATALLLDIVGGEPGPVTDAVAEAHLPARPPVNLRRARIERLLGMGIADDTVRDVLERLELSIEASSEGWKVTPPPFRFDIAVEADLVEELARIVGYGEVPVLRPRGELAIEPVPEARTPASAYRDALVQRGYHEAITYSFVDAELERLIDPAAEPLALANPLSAELAVMRTTLLAGLLRALAHNSKRQQARVRLFEIGLVFARSDDALRQTPAIGGIAAGSPWPEQWGMPKRELDFYDAKGDVEALLALGGCRGEYRFVPACEAALHPGQGAIIERDGTRVGALGLVHPRIARELKLPGRTFVFELDLAALGRGRVPRYAPLSRFPAVRRDVAVVVDESVPAAALADSVGQNAGDMLQNLQLFDVYRGEGIDPGKKSLALSLTFQAASRTLSDEEVDALVGRVVQAMRAQFGAVLRG